MTRSRRPVGVERHPAAGRSMLRWATLGACAAALAAFLLWPYPPVGQSYPAASVPRWIAPIAALSGAAAASLQRAQPRPRVVSQYRWVLTLSWCACALLGLSGGVVFEVLAAVRVVPTPFDWSSFLTRVLALGGAVFLAASTLLYQRAWRDRPGVPAAPGRALPQWGYCAFLLALPYTLLKAYWALGGTGGFPAGGSLPGYFGTGWGELLAGWGTVIAGVIGALLGLALVPRGTSPCPRWMLLGAGWFGATTLLSAGLAGTYGLVTSALTPSSSGEYFAGWVLPVVYGGFPLWGAALGAATWSYQEQTRS